MPGAFRGTKPTRAATVNLIRRISCPSFLSRCDMNRLRHRRVDQKSPQVSDQLTHRRLLTGSVFEMR